MIPYIYIGLALLDALLLWAVIYARGKWALKLAAMLVVLGFNFGVWNALSSFKGWPTTATPPARAQFIEGVVHEPDTQTGDPGAIYLWLVPLTNPGSPLAYQQSNGEPRAYRLPYSEQLYKQVLAADAAKKRGHGQPVIVQRAGARRGHGHGRPTNLNTPRFQMHSYVLPPPHPPRKGHS